MAAPWAVNATRSGAGAFKQAQASVPSTIATGRPAAPGSGSTHERIKTMKIMYTARATSTGGRSG
ncbi:MAG: hypothetical protein JWR39_86, partial [Devosia sp.]|nr:hypothetical protein [Devosia sp.]